MRFLGRIFKALGRAAAGFALGGPKGALIGGVSGLFGGGNKTPTSPQGTPINTEETEQLRQQQEDLERRRKLFGDPSKRSTQLTNPTGSILSASDVSGGLLNKARSTLFGG